MSVDMTPLLFDGWKVKIQMTDGNEITLYKENFPDALAKEVEEICREHFESHYETMIAKHREG